MNRNAKHFFLSVLAVLMLIAFAAIDNNLKAQSLKLLLSFNQPTYVPGDTAFFRGRLLSVADQKPVQGRRVISFMLLGSDGKLHFHNRVVFQDGSCSNQFALTVASDQYSLVAFIEGQGIQENPRPILTMPFFVTGEKRFVNKNGGEQEKVNETNNVSVSIKPDKESYLVRKPVNVQVSIGDITNKALEGDFSVSVMYSDLFDGVMPPSPERFFNRSDVKSNPSTGIEKSMAYYFKGKVITKEVLEDSTQVTFYLNRNDFVYPLYISSTGTFEFPLFKDFGDERIYYTITHKGKPVEGTVISEAPTIRMDSVGIPMMSNEEDKYSSFAKKRNVVMKSFLYYSNRLPKKEDEEWLDSDFDIELDKFEPFSSMSELLGNIVQMVRYRKRGNEEMVRVFLKDNAIYATVDPLYIIDGVMMDNTKYFLNLLPANVDKIGILRSQATLSRYGELGKNGIILVRTKPTSREGLPSNQHEVFVTGMNKSMPFNSPSHANEKQLQIPDLRSTLYWNPKILTDNQGKASFSFYTGDATGTFKIRIEGMTKNGIPFTKEVPFMVSYEKP